MAGGKSIIKLSDSSNVKINMDNAYISGNLENTTVLDIQRSKGVNVSAKGMEVHDTSNRYGYAPPRQRRPPSSSSSSDDDTHPFPTQCSGGQPFQSARPVRRVAINMEVNERRSLATRFEEHRTIGDIKNYMRARSDVHKQRDFILVNQRNESQTFPDESQSIRDLGFVDNTKLTTRFI